MNLPRVLVAAPTSDRKSYILPKYFESIRNFTYPEKYFYFVDNSYDQLFHVKEIILRGFLCDYVHPQNKPNNVYICQSFQKIREYFLKNDFDYLLSLECDLIPPTNIIEQLLAYNKEVVSARYFIGNGENTRLLGFEVDDGFGLNFNKNIWLEEGFHEYGTGKTKSKNCGLGCVLIRKDVLKYIPFYVRDEVTHNDAYFSLELDYHGVDFCYHEEIIPHYNSGWLGVTDFGKR